MHEAIRKDKRSSLRVPYAIKVLIVHSDMAWAADVLDLSQGGAGVFRPAGCLLHPGNVALLYFFEGPGPAVAVSARVARITERHIGFEYHEPQAVPPLPV